MHAKRPYDPAKAREYYLRTRKLKGRKKGSSSTDGAAPKGKAPVNSAAKARKRQELAERINRLEGKLAKLERAIKETEAKDKKAAKEAAKPDTKAEKSKKARDSKKYRSKNKQKLATKAKTAASKSGGGSKASSTPKASSVDSKKVLATKIKGQLAVAKSKLRAL